VFFVGLMLEAELGGAVRVETGRRLVEQERCVAKKAASCTVAP